MQYTSQGVPVRTKVDDYPVRHSFMHAYHHPDRLQPDRAWMDWFTAFREGGDAGKTYGLEFVEGLWIEKLAVLAVVLTLGMVTASLVWGLKGGSLDTIFTTMDFVESGFAGEFLVSARTVCSRERLLVCVEWLLTFVPCSDHCFDGAVLPDGAHSVSELGSGGGLVLVLRGEMECRSLNLCFNGVWL